MLVVHKQAFMILLRNSQEGMTMRGDRNLQNPMFLAANAEERLAADHQLRAIKRQAGGKKRDCDTAREPREI